MPNPPRTKVLPHLRNKKPRFPGDTETKPPSLGGRRIRMALTAGAMLFTLFIIYPIIERTVQRQTTANINEVTDCDRFAANPDDTQKLAVGVRQEQINVGAARIACHKALLAHPDDGRILYQLSRTYIAGSDMTLGLSYLRKSADAGYAQGQFILADMLIHDGNAEVCIGGQLLVKAARQRHFSSKIALAVNWLNGQFKSCGLDMTDGEIGQLLSAAGELAITQDEKSELSTVAGKWANH